ncbi:MAG: TSUP family transporter, partial [Vampirovibrionales bacterium]
MLDLTHLPAYLTDPMSLVLIALLGGVIGLLSGLLGIGGGLLIMPALVLLPPLLFGKPWLSLQLASGVAALQGLASSTAGTWVHYRSKRLNKAWVLALGLPAIAGGIVGAIVAQYWSKQLMLGVLAAVLAFTLFQTVKTFAKLYLLPKPTEAVEEPPLKEWTHLSGKAQAGMMLASLLIGVLAGVIGLGGAMFYI